MELEERIELLKKNVSGMTLTFLLISMIISTFSVGTVKAEQVTVSPWPQFQHDAQHTGRSPFVGPSENPQVEILLGKQSLDSYYYFGCPVIDSNGTLYFYFGEAGYLPRGGVCARYGNGTEKWFYETTVLFNEGVAWGWGKSPVLLESEGIIYITRYDSEMEEIVCAINAESGSLIWEKTVDGAIDSQHLTISDDGVLYFVERQQWYDGPLNESSSLHTKFSLSGLDKNGIEVLSYDIAEVVGHDYPPFFGCPSIDHEGIIYFGYNDTLFAVNPDGTERWKRSFEANLKYHLSGVCRVMGPSIANDGTLYVVVYQQSDWQDGSNEGFNNHLHAIDPENPFLEKWTRIYNYPSLDEGFNPPAFPPRIDFDGNVYVTSYSASDSPDPSLRQIFTLVFTHGGDMLMNFTGGATVIDAQRTVYYVGAYHPQLEIFVSEGNRLSVPLGPGVIACELSLASDGTLYMGGSCLYAVKSSITPQENQLPVGSFIYNPPNPIIGEDITFDASASYDLDGEIITYQWDFGDGATPEGIIVNHSFPSIGFYTVTLTVTDNEGATNRVTETVKVWDTWAFAIINDLHIGRGYPDYGGKGIETEDMQVEGQDYYLTERLQRTVEWIIDNRDNYNIRFVIVLGDISDSGEYSELKKAKDILDNLNEENIPYIPVIGNHDVWPFTEENEENQNEHFFELIFEEQIGKLMRDASFNLRKQPISDILNFGDPVDLQNYVFEYKGTNFIVLDCVSRTAAPEGVLFNAVLWDSTLYWLTDNLRAGQPTIILSHHPLIAPRPDAFINPLDILTINETIKISTAKVLANFAGHIHGSYPSFRGDAPIFMDANKNWAEEWYVITPANMPVVTTEALMVASNEQTSKGIIRLVEVKGGEINNYENIEGEFHALNPYFKPTASVLFQNTLYQEFKAYAFTKIFTEQFPLSYTLQFGDGSSQTVLSTSGEPVKFWHYYDAWRPDNAYDVTLTVQGYAPDGTGLVEEEITKTMTFSVSWLSVIAHSPVDIVVTDPEGIIVSKQLQEIPESTYLEIDINEDGDLDDIVIIPNRKIGDYLVTVVPEPDAAPTDMYTLEVRVNGIITVLAEDVEISNIPTQSYIIRSTETEIIPIIITWEYVFEDEGRGTMLKISTEDRLFQFITPDKDYGIRNATYMRVYNRAIIICHKDGELKLATVSVDTKLDFCIAYAKDTQTGKEYWLIDKVGTEN
jgi:outer membrane protein assembly factor BamB